MTDTFSVIPAASKIWLPVFIAMLVSFMVLIVVVGFSARSIHSARHAKFDVSDFELAIKGEYSRSIRLSDLDLSKAEVVDLALRNDLRPGMRTYGTGLPGYQAGWFKLQNGQKALLYLTARNEVVHLPTNDGYDLLLSVNDPSTFLTSLRSHGMQQQ
jgi:hypothetical protein